MARILRFLPALLLTQALSADIVELTNGDRLTGSVRSISAGELLIETAYSAEIKIDFSQVRRLVSETPLVLNLDGVDPQQATFTVEGDTVEVTGAAAQSFQRGQLLGVEPIAVPEPDPNFLQGWDGGADLGWVVATGNSDIRTLSLNVDPVRETNTDKTTLTFRMLNSRQNGETSADQWSFVGRYDRTITDGIFAYGIGEFAADGQQNLDLRTRQGGGLGYNWDPRENLAVSFFGGVNAIQEKFIAMDRLNNAEGLAGVEMSVQVLGGLEAMSRFAYLPIFGEGRYQLAFAGGVRLPVLYGFTFGFSLTDDFDSAPPSATERNDLKFLMTLGYKF